MHVRRKISDEGRGALASEGGWWPTDRLSTLLLAVEGEKK